MATDTQHSLAEEMVSKVEPVLREYALQSETARRLAPEAMEVIIEAGLMRTWVPKAYGGHELDPITATRMFTELSRIYGSAGWVVSQCSIIAYLGQLFGPEANRDLFSDPRAVFAAGWWPPGTAERVEGGYRVTGRWSFNSGADYASWLQGQVLITEGGEPCLGPDGNPVAAVVTYPVKDAEILDTWHTLGMRGTGSNDCSLTDVFVPEERIWIMAPLSPTDPAFSGPLYRLGGWINVPAQTCVALGIAQAALADFLTLAEKTPSYQSGSIADKSVVQDHVARARATIDAAESYLERMLERAWEYVLGGSKLDMERGVALALAGCHAHEAACDAVDLIHACAGSTAVRNEQPFERYFRDVHTLSQHAFTGPARFESLGKLLMGRTSDWGFYYL